MKKLLACFLTLAMLCTVSLPALAAEADPDLLPQDSQFEAWESTEYDLGWGDGYSQGYDQGYAWGLADGKAGLPRTLDSYDPQNTETYEEGFAYGLVCGQEEGYFDGYYEAAGHSCWVDQEILDLGGVPGQVNVMVGGQLLSFSDAQPQIVGGRTMIPVRAVMEALDAQVSYDKAGRVVQIARDGVTVSFVIGSTTATIVTDGDESALAELDCAPYIQNSRTMVPLRFLSQTFGYTVLWDSEYRTAVVVDTEDLIDQVDSQFTQLNLCLAGQMAQQAGKKLQQTGKITGTLTLYDEAGKGYPCTFSASAAAYTDGKRTRMDLTINAEQLLRTLVKLYPDTLGQYPISLRTALETDPSAIPLTLLMTETGELYLQMPLYNTSAGLDQDAWLLLGRETAVPPLTQDLTIGSALVAPYLTDDGSFHLYEQLDSSLVLLEAMLGDAAATADGDRCTWRLDAGSLAEAGLLIGTPEELALLNDLSLVTTMDRSGSYTMTGSLAYAGEDGMVSFGLDASGSAKGGTCKLTAAAEGVFTLSLTAVSTTKTVSTLPSLTLPEGALVEDLTA